MMTRHAFLPALAIVFLLLSAPSAFAKRTGPQPVAPVVHNGVKYVAANDTGREGRVDALDVATGKKLWTAVAYTVKVDPNLEEDVQWVFITKLEMGDDGGSLRVTNEDKKTFTLDLKTGKAR